MGVIDFLDQVMLQSRIDTSKWQQQPVPDQEKAAVTDARKKIQEAAAETDDQLLEQYLSVGELTQPELINGLRVGVQAGTIVPLYAGSATRNIGIVPLLNAIVELQPSPASRTEKVPLAGRHPETNQEVTRRGAVEEPFSGLIFKTIIDPFVGRLSYLRVLSGTLQSDSILFNASRKIKEKSGHLYQLVGKKHTAVASAGAGDIVAIGKLKEGQTLFCGAEFSGWEEPPGDGAIRGAGLAIVAP